MLKEFIQAFLLIFIAEMGDKTQILAMAFATKFPVKKVLLGIFLGALLNHGIAVALGSFISVYVPIKTVQMIAGIAFIGFAFWTLKDEDGEEEEDEKRQSFGPVLTVAVAFFLGELGDKTQLTAITLATTAVHPAVILAGTVSGMIVTGGIGIFIGKKLGDRIPEFTIKLGAAAVFLFFGVLKLVKTVNFTPLMASVLIFAVLTISAVLLRPQLRRRKEGRQSAYVSAAKALHDHYMAVNDQLESICLGTEACGTCKGEKCLLGYTKSLVQIGMNPESFESMGEQATEVPENKVFDKGEVEKGIELAEAALRENPQGRDRVLIKRILENLKRMSQGK